MPRTIDSESRFGPWRQLALLAVVGGFIAMGHIYKEGCLDAGGDFEQCWDKGLAIGGINPGGPLGAGTIVGVIIGQMNKEAERRKAYEEGFWTYNAHLERPTPKEQQNDEQPRT